MEVEANAGTLRCICGSGEGVGRSETLGPGRQALVLEILAARWSSFAGRPSVASAACFEDVEWPLFHWEAKCRRCGATLAEAGVRQTDDVVRTVFVPWGFEFDHGTHAWKVSKRYIKRDGRPPRSMGRHSRSDDEVRYVRESDPERGVVARVEAEDVVEYEVALPAKVWCPRCDWPIKVNPVPELTQQDLALREKKSKISLS